MRIGQDTMGDGAATEASRRTYERMAGVYDLLDAGYEIAWKRRLRGEVFARVRGRLLDVGVGTGCNIPFYPKDCEATGIDNSPAMLRRAARRAVQHGRGVALMERDILATGLPDGVFDSVVATYVLCCLPRERQRDALVEMRRLCAPGGRIVLLDYGLSQRPLVRLGMRILSPWLKWAFAARYDAGTEEAIGPAGLRVVERRLFFGDTVRLLVLDRA
ncbi:MAG: class I SAM-dependent methyltransferase [Alphaproteobacteria bacterium]